MSGALHLRAYQQDALGAVLGAHDRGVRSALLVMPTGSGKTVVFAHAILNLLRPGERALVLAHRDELITQAVGKLRDVLGDALPIGVVKAGSDETDTPIVVASVQTLSRPARLERLGDDFAVVIVDEAHHAAAETYRRVLNSLDAPFVLGVTATADRGDGVGLGAIFAEIVYELPMLELIGDGYLVDLRAKQIAVNADFRSLHTRAGDIVDSEAAGMLLAADAPATIARAYRQFVPERKGIVFTPTVVVAHAMAGALRGEGIAAAALDGTTPLPERRDILADLKTGAVQVVVNCGVLTEGFDEPSIDCITIAKPTKSRGHYMQMIGRGTRPYPGKTDCVILDTVGCATRLDLMTAASLFGLSLDALATQSVSEAMAAPAAPELTPPVAGELVAMDVDLFRQRPAHWLPTGTGRFVLPTGDGTLVLRPHHGDGWDVLHVPRQGRPAALATGLSLGYAQGVAEDHARATGGRVLIDRDAPWRTAPSSEKQISFLHGLGVPLGAIRTKGEASDAISAAIAAKAA